MKRWRIGCVGLLMLCAWIPGVRAECFYDGVSEVRLDQFIEWLTERYQVAVISKEAADTKIPLPLGQCPLHQYLALVTEHSRWRASEEQAGGILSLVRADTRSFVVESGGEASPSIEEVLVTGQRWNHDPVLEARYRSSTLLETASAAPGQLGGNDSITAALGRMAAVTFSQEAGTDRNISIRGMDSNFTRVLVNGMPMLATGASIDARGAVNNSRSFDFNVLPDGLFTRAQVIKLGDARTAEGAIGGSVDLRTPMPLGFPDRQSQWLNVQNETSGRGSGNDSGSEWGSDSPIAGVAVAGGFHRVSEDGHRGWLLSLSTRQRQLRELGYSTVRWQAAEWGDQPGLTEQQQRLLASEEEPLFSPRHNRYDILDRHQTTLGATLAYQWHDTPWGNFDLIWVGTRHRQEMHEYHITAAGLRQSDLTHIQLNDFELDGQSMVFGDFSNVDIRSEHNWQVDQTDLRQLKIDWQRPISERLSVQTSYGYQTSRYDSPIHDQVALVARGQDFSYDLRTNDRISVNRFGFDIQDSTQWQLQKVSLDEDSVSNRYQVAELEIGYRQDGGPVNWHHYWGLQWQRFDNRRREASYSNSELGTDVFGFYQHTPGNYRDIGGPSGLPQYWIAGDVGLLGHLGVTDADLVSDPTQQRHLREDHWSSWWQSEFELPGLLMDVRGNVGLRFSHTRQYVKGSLVLDDQLLPVDSVESSTQWLPSMHLVAQLRDNLVVRSGYSRELARPSIDELSEPLLLRTSAQLVEGGNTRLRPQRAHAFELVGEWYGESSAFAATTLFYTRIDSLILEQVSDVTLDELPYYNPQWDELARADATYEYRRPINGPGTDITGLELNLALPFNRLPGAFRHLGLDLGYVFSRAVVRYPTDDGYVTLPPPGLSRHVVNADVWYRHQQFRVGVTVRARSRYLTQVPGNNDNDREGVNSAWLLGAYGSWHFSPTARVSLDATNLTDEPYDQFVDASNRVYSYSRTGSRIQLGLGWQW